MSQTLNQKIALLRASIVGLKQVRAHYHGHERVFCTHILGTKNQAWKAFVWQFDGSSSKPSELPTWRDLSVDQLIDLTLHDGDWHRGWVTGQREQRSIHEIDTVVDAAHAAVVRNIPPRILQC